ncbi:DNA -binding domain-containing protein [Mesorhizobium sp. CA10]|uniref:DNA -binding domain-containing protein n=1 Tax=Mesorhizobium sp. CA10 TaxID=588495 RepID=UPI00398D2DCF
MLRCLDGLEEQVATALFGRRLVSTADWHDSAFRYQTHRLVRDGLKMVERGHRQLLRARRRRS